MTVSILYTFVLVASVLILLRHSFSYLGISYLLLRVPEDLTHRLFASTSVSSIVFLLP